MSTSDVQKIEWAHGNFLRYSKLMLGGWYFLDCFRVRKPIETCFASHIQHFKCIKMFFFVPGQFSMQCILIPWYLLTFICDRDTLI